MTRRRVQQSRLRISVIVPVFDAERFVAATVWSVLRQTRAVDEVIVVDNGSTDRTAEIVSSIEAQRAEVGRRGGAGRG